MCSMFVEEEGDLQRGTSSWKSHSFVLVKALIYGSLFYFQSIDEGKLKVIKPKMSFQSILGKSASPAS